MKDVKGNIETNDPVSEESSRRIRKNFTEDPGWPRKPAGPDPTLRSDPPRTTRCPPLGAPGSRKVSAKEPTGGHGMGLPRGSRTGARGDPKKVTTSRERT